MADKIYWDTDCFLGWLQEEAGKVDSCRQVLQSAEEGSVIIVTSTLTLAEALKMKKRAAIPQTQRDQVNAFFKNEYIAVRGVDRATAELARDLVWDNGIDSKDAIHVATALRAGLAMMHTFDADLIKKSGTVGNPRLIIERPSVSEPKLNLTVVKNDEEKTGTE